MRSAYVFARVYECKPCIYVRVDVRKTKRYKLVTHACTFVWPTGATVPLLCSLVYVCVCVWTSARNTSYNSAECEHVKHRLYPRVRACVTFVGGARMSSHFSTRLLPSRQERFRFVSNFWHLSYFSFFLSLFLGRVVFYLDSIWTAFALPAGEKRFLKLNNETFAFSPIDYRSSKRKIWIDSRV